MPIDFFQAGCRTESSIKIFGLCDNPPPATDPAYIDELDTSKWIGEVVKDDELPVAFYAIDHCVEVRRPNNDLAKRCDGILVYRDNITFVELKDRGSSGWVSGGRKQLTETILFFKANHDIGVYSIADARICNKQQPLAVTNIATEIQKLKDDTGLKLIVDRAIKI